MRRSRRRRIFIAAIIGGLLATAWTVWPREKLLLPRATKVADTTDWEGERFNVSIGVHWLSDHEILFNRYEGTQKQSRIIYRRDLATGQEKKLPGLTQNADATSAEVMDAKALSPDGRWLVCSSRWQRCWLFEVNGTHCYSYPSADTASYCSVFWMDDSRHWLEIYGCNDFTTKVILHDIQKPTVRTFLPQPACKQFSAGVYTVNSFEHVVSIADSADDSMRTVTVSKLCVTSEPSSQPHYKISFPRPGREGNPEEDARYYVSPRAERIAWEFTTDEPDTTPHWLRRILPFVSFRDRKKQSLWVSNLDGSHMHEIGHITVKMADENENDDWFWNVQWLPDNKHLSFEYKNALWTVPTD